MLMIFKVVLNEPDDGLVIKKFDVEDNDSLKAEIKKYIDKLYDINCKVDYTKRKIYDVNSSSKAALLDIVSITECSKYEVWLDDENEDSKVLEEFDTEEEAFNYTKSIQSKIEGDIYVVDPEGFIIEEE